MVVVSAHDRAFKNTGLWKLQYVPRLNIVKKANPKLYAILIKKPLSVQIQNIDRWQSQGLFG
jgi:hypothetical protein